MKTLFCVVFLFPIMCYSQSFNKIGVRLNYSIAQPITEIDAYYLNQDFKNIPYQRATLLSEIEIAYNFEIAAIYAGISKKYDLEFIIKSIKYSRDDNRFYKNLLIKTHSVGLGNVLKLVHKKRLVLSSYFNAFLSFSRLTSDNREVIVETDGKNYSLVLQISYAERKINFTNSSFDFGGIINFEYTSRLSVQARLGLSLTNFPDFDIPSPVFYKTLQLGVGLKYELFKNKKFYYSL